MNTSELRVELAERSYSIVVGQGALARLADRVAGLFPKANHAIVIHDSNVTAIAQSASEQFRAKQWRVGHIEIASGESSKSVDQLGRIWHELLANRADRGSIVVAVGGGVVGDLAGFAAATFARGLSLVQVPTTLLSQVDSSVGGKTGINLTSAKNMVGAFWQPSLVMIDTMTLDSLPTREYVSGIAEIVKYGVILLPDLFEYLHANVTAILNRDAQVLRHIVIESCRAKAMVVQQDERETTGLRAILNYGHTFAHAIEATAGYGTLLHGEAVAIGMNMAGHLAQLLGRVDLSFVERQAQLMQALTLPTTLAPSDVDAMWDVMLTDKKVEHGKLRFVLPTRLGHVELVPGVPRELAIEAIKRCTKG